MKKAKIKRLPKFKSEDEECEFWANHLPLDYFDMAKARKFTLPKLKPSAKTISIRQNPKDWTILA
ncbi:MAG: CopG family antitoxin [Planctomycetota bacterium]|nr:CopG family antitoxin [Planctomycetota bacterium]